jgi:hypothetical protein
MMQEYYMDAKIVIAERDVQQASMMLDDYENVLVGVTHGVFPRNRGACENYGSLCEYRSLCGQCLTKPEEDAKVEEWVKTYGE